MAVALCSDRALAQHLVAPAFGTPEFPAANVDSCAVWVPPDGSGDPLLFATEKDGDKIEVWRADTGGAWEPKPQLGGIPDSPLPGHFDRPNGVWVIYHVPWAGGFADILLVTDQRNLRVQAFRLPELEYFGEFGNGEIGKGYGIAWHQDGTDVFVHITDNIPPGEHPGKVKTYRLRPEGGGIGADPVASFGSGSGAVPLPNVESILVDPPHDRIHVCGDEGGSSIRLFRMDGTYTGTSYGAPQFEYDQEGINLYDTGAATGYLVVSDQYRDRANQFELFDRASLASLGNFRSPDDAALVTSNTDGAYLEQRGFRGFPDGAFFAVHDDRSVHAYDWTDIAEIFGLRIVPLDRSFRADPEGGTRVAPGDVWFHDGSWWSVVERDGTPMVARLEDGTFAPQVALAGVGPSLAAAAGADLFVLEGDGAVERLRYDAPRRRYVASAALAPPPAWEPSAAIALETGEDGSVSGLRVAWVGGGRLLSARADPGLGSWSAGDDLGPASGVRPAALELPAGPAVVWADGAVLRVALREGGNAWSEPETIPSGPAAQVASLAAAALPGGELVVLATTADGTPSLSRRGADGAWASVPISGSIRDPALVPDPSAGRIHLLHAIEQDGRRLVGRRDAPLESLTFGSGSLLIGWPGVSMEAILVPRSAAPHAPDLVIATVGDDGRGYLGRIPRPGGDDGLPPITFGHRPAPDDDDVAAGPEIWFRVQDSGAGVDRSSVRLLVGGTSAAPRIRGVPGSWIVSHRLPTSVVGDVAVRIEASDLEGNVMTPFEYSFRIGGAGEPELRRGDANSDGVVEVSDSVTILLELFGGLEPRPCRDAADSNDDGAVDLADAVFLLRYLFLAGPVLPEPSGSCGPDPTADGLDCPPGACR